MRKKPLVLVMFLNLLIFPVESQSVESQLWRDFINGNRCACQGTIGPLQNLQIMNKAPFKSS